MKIDKLNLKSLCHVCTNIGEDTFVGLRKMDKEIQVCFPIGYRLAVDDKGIRKDILLLLRVLRQFADMNYECDNNEASFNSIESFPLISYQKIIMNYINFGYAYEKEVNYKTAKQGKIDWNKTIKMQSPVMAGNNLVYLDFTVKNVEHSKDTIITWIHEYCVYESIYNIGWLYNIPLPKKPRLKFNKELFLNVLYEKIKFTFNDRTKELLTAMTDIIRSINTVDGRARRFGFGTSRFEYVWEKMIDYTYGIKDKVKYFPKTNWRLNNGTLRINSPLEPDSIMCYKKNIYILDAKYYKYGVSGLSSQLPETSSISKQITYGEYVDQIKITDGDIYNAFIMPYDKESRIFKNADKVIAIGEANADWKGNTKKYHRVVGVLIDIKDMMMQYTTSDRNDIAQMAEVIEKELEDK